MVLFGLLVIRPLPRVLEGLTVVMPFNKHKGYTICITTLYKLATARLPDLARKIFEFFSIITN